VLGNYLPRQCGIATFTTDLAQALAADNLDVQVDVVAMSDHPETVYPERVKRRVEASEHEEYHTAADFLNAGGYDVLSVQHEYGIFGGEDGDYLLTLLRAVKMPIVTTLHTVLRDPTPSQRTVTAELLQLSERVVVMSQLAVGILEAEYALSQDRIDLIPHGIPDFSSAVIPNIKEALGIEGSMILTFGLLSPDKGIQYVIEAMPKILEADPGAVYVVLGATHPKVIAHAGESYRNSLLELVSTLGIEDSVRFVDRFVSQEELVTYLGEADVYVTPYLNPKQITSGTLAYALGAGKAVVSTPYLYAEELLSDGRGLLVPFRNSEAIADAIISLHSSDVAREQMLLRANQFGIQMQWPQIGKRYANTFSEAIQRSADSLRSMTEPKAPADTCLVLPHLSTSHLSTLTDDTGIFQHAVRNVPNRAHGYCVDDNARALLFTTYLEDDRKLTPYLVNMQSRYLSFVHDSLNEDNGRFRNFMSYSRQWLESEGSDDSHARTLWSLGSVVHRSATMGHKNLAADLFRLGSPAVYKMNSPRAWAYAILAADEFLNTYTNDERAHDLREQMASRLLRGYRTYRTDDWRWFEPVVSYANARLSQALIVAGQWMGDQEMLAAGIESLEWLMHHQSNERGDFRPVGSDGFWKQGRPKAEFDQQPLEAWVSVSACISAAHATGDQEWISKAENAFAWFMGRNDLAVSVYDPSTGGCRDGIHADRPNENQGAESTLSFLCAHTELESAFAWQKASKNSVHLI